MMNENELSLTAPAGHILPFMFENMPVRGQLLRLNNMGQHIPSLNEKGDVGQMLTEMLAANAILVHDLKHEANVTLQLHSSSDVSLLVSQCDKEGGMRAYANFVEGSQHENVTYADVFKTQSMFAVTVEQNDQRYQSLIGLHKHSVAASVEQYFNDSVQLPTHLRVWSDPKNPGTCGALFLQVMPSETATEDDWQRLSFILDTVKLDEIIEGRLADRELLGRLFAEDDVRIFEQKEMNVVMPNMKARMQTAIRSLGVKQVKELLAEGPIEMKDEFSGQMFSFKEADMRNIFGTHWEEE